jgi:pantoate--beta-alanine ligase
MVKAGIRNTAKITDEIKKVIDGTPSARVQYINIVDPGTLADVATIRGKALLAMAVFIGKTRLIDNTMLGDVRE